MQWKWRANKLRFDASFLDEKSTSFCFLDGDLCNRKRDAITCCQAYNISYLACMTNTWHSKDSFSTFSRTTLLVRLSSSLDTRQYSRVHIQGLPHFGVPSILFREKPSAFDRAKRFPRHYNFSLQKTEFGCWIWWCPIQPMTFPTWLRAAMMNCD